MFSIFFVVGAAVAAGMALAVIATRTKPPGMLETVLPEDDYATATSLPRPPRECLTRLAELIAQKNGLEIRERLPESPRITYWLLESTNPVFSGTYVFCLLASTDEQPLVTLSEVFELKDFIKGCGGAKGFLLTDGYFTRDVHQPLEGPKVALYNRRQVLEELRKLETEK